MTMPLEGIRIVEWAMWMSGPMSTSFLGDLGADIIKIEQPGVGDELRGLLTGGDRLLPDGRHALFEAYNRNKRSIILNLKQEKGKKIAHQLVKQADVFIHNYRKKLASRLCMDYQTLSQINPRIIYATASGYGRKGPDRDLRAFDMAGKARSGYMAALAGPDGVPQEGPSGIADQITAIMLSQGIVTALLTRERHGIGQEIDVSLLGSMIYLQHWAVSTGMFFNRLPVRPQTRGHRNPLLACYKCKDDKWLALIMQADHFWPQFCQAIGLETLEKNPKFDVLSHRQENAAELVAILDNLFATKTREEWAGDLARADLVFCPVNSMLDLTSDPQVVENDYIIDFNHPSLGSVNLTGFPVWFSKTPPQVKKPAPLHGQHTEEVLAEELGLSREEISSLKEEGVIN